ncbi:MAG: hotdog fold domain-containing protein, partial [Acidimicrobiia bacterium]
VDRERSASLLDAATVFADFRLDDRFSGAPAYLHGGVILAVLDEAMAWAAIAVAGQWAVTHTTSTTFDKPVRVDQPYRVEARIDAIADDRIEASASVVDGRGTARVRSTATFVALGTAEAIDAIGAVPTDADTAFLRD